MLPRIRPILLVIAVFGAWYVGTLGRGCYRELQAGARKYDLCERLEQAALEGNSAEVRRLLHEGANPNYMGNGHSILGCAWQSEDKRTINAMMDARPDLNQPLIEASFHGDVKFIRFLVKHGADPNAKLGSDSVLTIARQQMNKEAEQVLRQFGAH